MKKSIMIALLTALLLGAAGTTQARDRDRGYRDGHDRGYATTSHYRRDRHAPNHYYQRHNYRHYRSHHNRPYRYSHYRNDYYGHHGHHGGLRIAAGAIIAGSLINAIRYERPERVVYSSRRYSSPAPYAGQQDRWYRSDNHGDCFEVRLNRDDQEVWTWVDPSYCY